MQSGAGLGGRKNQLRMNYSKLLDSLKNSAATPTLISIDGVAGSGKTTLAQKIRKDLTTLEIIHMDDLYDGWINPLSGELSNRITEQILAPYIEKKSAKYKKYNWATEEFDVEIQVPGAKYLVLEGVGAGQSAFREFIDVAIWIECDPNVGLERVIKRDGEQIRKHMLSFLVDQNKHFSHERTSDYAHYTLNGAP